MILPLPHPRNFIQILPLQKNPWNIFSPKVFIIFHRANNKTVKGKGKNNFIQGWNLETCLNIHHGPSWISKFLMPGPGETFFIQFPKARRILKYSDLTFCTQTILRICLCLLAGRTTSYLTFF